MADQPQTAQRLVVVGANHATASALLRDRLFVDDGQAPGFLSNLKRAGIAQSLVLSTCDRVEVVAVHDRIQELRDHVLRALSDHGEVTRAEVQEVLYARADREALRHVFAVAASLDSVVVGEPQVLGQVKAAHRTARAAGTVGAQLEHTLQATYATAKRVRTETSIARGPVTIAASAVRVARDVHGALDRCGALLIGGGEMGEVVVSRLRDAGLARLAVAASTAQRAAATAHRLQCRAVTFDELAGAVADADIVVSAAGLGRHLISAELFAGALTRRRYKPLFVIDAAVPGDVEPAAARLDEVFLYDLDDLEGVAQDGRATRLKATADAWRIVEAAADQFLEARLQRDAAPTLERLRRHFEAARADALSHAPKDASEATRLMLNRLLHDPAQALRTDAGDDGCDDRLAAAVRRLFRLTSDARDEEETGE